MNDPASRMLRLLSLLQTHRSWAGADLAERLGVSPRTVRRDVDRLRGLGYPVNATTGVAGGYRLEAGGAMPPLLLDDEEAVAIAVGLRTAAGGGVAGIEETSVRALAKLEQVLPARLRRRINALQAFTVPLARPGATVDPESLAVIALACRDYERLRFGYRSRDGTASKRMVEPHRLVPAGRRWYLVAWDVDRADWRTFRVDRLDPPQVTGIRFTPRRLPAEDAAAFVRESIGALASRHRVLVTVHASAESVAERWHWRDGLEAVDERTCRVRAEVESLEWLTAMIGVLDAEFEVHEPPELAAHVRALAGRFARSIASAPGDASSLGQDSR